MFYASPQLFKSLNYPFITSNTHVLPDISINRSWIVRTFLAAVNSFLIYFDFLSILHNALLINFSTNVDRCVLLQYIGVAKYLRITLNMPITKSAKKAMRQAITRTERNKAIKSQVKTYVKKVLVLSKTDVEGAKKILPQAFSVIDTACKKHHLHKNNAARKKSRLARVVQAAEGKTKK